MANFMGKVMDEILEYQVFLGALASIVSGILVRFQTSSCKIVRVLKPKGLSIYYVSTFWGIWTPLVVL